MFVKWSLCYSWPMRTYHTNAVFLWLKAKNENKLWVDIFENATALFCVTSQVDMMMSLLRDACPWYRHNVVLPNAMLPFVSNPNIIRFYFINPN